MNKITLIMNLRLKIIFSNKRLVLLSVIVPSLVVFMISTFFTSFSHTLSIPIGLIDYDNTAISHRLMTNLAANDYLEIMTNEEAEAIRMVESNKIEAYFIIKDGFQRRINTLEYDQAISINYLDKNYIAPSLIDLLAKDVLYEIAKSSASNKVNLYTKDPNYVASVDALFDTLLIDDGFRMHINYSFKSNTTENSNSLELGDILPLKLSLGLSTTFITVFLFYIGSAIIIEKSMYTDQRLKSIGIKPFQQILGNFMGELIFSLLIILVYLLTLLLSLDLVIFEMLYPLFIILIVYAMVILMISTLLIHFIKSIDHYQSLIVPLVFIISLIGGGIWPLEMFPSNIRSFSVASPSYWLIEEMMHIIYHNQFSATYLILIFAAFILFIVAAKINQTLRIS